MTAAHPVTPLQTAAALAIGTVALLMPGVQPILLGELVAQKHISMEGVGLVAMGEIVTLGLGLILGNSLLSLTRMRSVAVVAALLVALFDLATAILDGDMAFAAVRALAGLAEGVLLWVTTCTIVRAAMPDRLAGIFLVVQTLAQAGVAALLAVVVMPQGGWPAGFAVLAALSLLLVLLAPLLRPAVAPLVADGATLPAFTTAGVLALLPAFGQMAAIGSLWAYLDPLGRGAGLDAQAVQMLISTVLIVQVVGGIVASVVVRRIRAAATLTLGLLLQAVLTLAIAAIGAPDPIRFSLLCAGFGFVWLFSMPFHIRLAFHADPAGRLAALVPGLQLLGVAFGPLLTSAFVAGDDAGPVPLVSAGFAIFAIASLLAGRRRWRGFDRSAACSD
jgi:DHA1 family inner membrane transport protein